MPTPPDSVVGSLPPAVAAAIQDHCLACYPSEACGILVGQPGAPSRFLPMDNQADRLHAMDPEEFPRTSRDFFALNMAKVMKAVREAEAAGEAWLAIVHSHIDCGAYFSSEDVRNAAPEGEPAFPDLDQIVVDVRAWGVVEARSFRWNGQGFVPCRTWTAEIAKER